MGRKKRFTPHLLPEYLVPKELAEQDLYREAGHACAKCDFATAKSGFAGRQALRAHQKTHKRDRRAWVRPFVKQSCVAVALATSAIVGTIFQMRPALDFGPVVAVPGTLLTWPVLGANLVALPLNYMALIGDESAGRVLAKTLQVLMVFGTLQGLLGNAFAWELIAADLLWPAPMLLWGFLALTP